MANGMGALDLSSLSSFGFPSSGGGGNNELGMISALDNITNPNVANSFQNLPFSSMNAGATTALPGGGTDWGNFLFGGKDQSGALGLGFDFLSGLANYKLLNDQLSLAEDQFDFSKNFANRNLQNQAKTINTSLSDRQNARLGSVGDSAVSGTGYESLDSYMDANALSEKRVK